MSNKKFKSAALIIIVGLIIKNIVPIVYAKESGQIEELEVSQQVRRITPLSMQMVDQATAVLAKGWSGMSPAEQEAFLNLFDPANSGEIDQAFVQSVSGNYQKIRSALEKEIKVAYEVDDDRCEGKRLYYTDIINLHVCPYFLTETNGTRKARTLIHEYAHIALLVKDRPYYRPTSKMYAELTPRGTWAADLPVIGPIIREIVAADTLYHPDAYAHFAVAVSGQPGALELYLDRGVDYSGKAYGGHPREDGTNINVTDSWALAPQGT